ncbi:hypothetical protein [Actinoplanes sp. NPDC051851]|uniref:hypothetical protein n=1 Tax=Actinoplanes sp. NPDC051851 TaxID=3154753 RepID=UPI0034393F0A
MQLTDSLTPVPRPDPDVLRQAAAHPESDPVYIWSYLLSRTVVGFLGLALPVVLILGDVFFLAGSPTARGSLSAYYHSGMRDVFVGTLWVTGVFLLTYKVFSRNLENLLSSLAGIAAILVAIFPTGLPPGHENEATPLQLRLGETAVERVHFTAAFVFIGLLAVICCFFARRESRRDEVDPGREHMFGSWFWGPFHYVCAGLVVAAVIFMAITRQLLIGETVAIVAFGLSWFAKGSELRTLYPRKA